MTVLIPVDSKNQDEANIISMNEKHTWAFVTIDEGQTTSCIFYDDRNDINEWVDSVVVINDKEYVWPFMEAGMIVLTAPLQKSIEEIIEAMLFKELHDLSF